MKKLKIFNALLVLLVVLFTSSLTSCSNENTGEDTAKIEEDNNSSTWEVLPENPIQEMTEIVEEELAKHNTKEDCWVTSRWVVYDITEFLSKHKAPLDKFCWTMEEFDKAYSNQHAYWKDDILIEYKVWNLK